MAKPIVLTHTRAPGDIACMTACIRDLATAFPGEYDIHVATTCRTLWDHNPHVADIHNSPPGNLGTIYSLDYGPFITAGQKQPMHFLTAFHQNLGKHLGHTVPVLKPHGDLHLDDWHKQNPPIEGRYWYIIAGGKSDMTTKIWSAHRWQQVVNILRQFGIRFVQDGAVFKGHRQPNLAGVLNTVGRTGLRDMLWMIYHADGVICHVTAAAHFAAALERPCVVIAGGREMWWWEAYVNTQEKAFGPLASPVRVPHRYLHTIGQLKCCQEKGCWRAKVHKGEPDKNHSYCHAVVDDGYGQQYPRCLANITVGHVVEAVLSYYGDGTTTKDEICGTSTVQNMPDVPATLRNTATDRSCTADCPA